MVFMQQDEREMQQLERLKQFLEVGAWIHAVLAVGSEVFRINDQREELVDVFLEMLDFVRQGTNEGLVQEAEVREEVVADDDVGFVAECCGDFVEFELNGFEFFFGVFAILVPEPFGFDF